MTDPVPIAVPRKGRPLEAVLERVASVAGVTPLADSISSALRYEKGITKGAITPEAGPYTRLTNYSDPTSAQSPEYTLVRDNRDGKPRRIVFDSVTLDIAGTTVRLVGREEPFRALRTHSFALGFDAADLVLEEVVELRPTGLGSLSDLNDRIDPQESDVKVVSGMDDTVYHTLLATPQKLPAGQQLDRSFVADYEGPVCISPRYERLVTAVVGTHALDGCHFTYPGSNQDEETAIADTGFGVYLTVTGSTAREHGLILGANLFPSETVLLENTVETTPRVQTVREAVAP
ncbi:MAG: hypothetical protein A07HR60_02154 [uncultured archaeon A07HR60]|nr:MAG: hypothetical protein A07HR60_02154 [uncultured archaeon A07HR60]